MSKKHFNQYLREQETAYNEDDEPQPPKANRVVFDADEAHYVGTDEDGVYFQTAEGHDGWYVTALVDSDSGSFTADLVTDDGPYATENDAEQAGRNAAIEWCVFNEVPIQNDSE